MFEKILIANRGEIAVRVMRACKEMGIATVAVYSDCDQKALHVRVANEAIPIGPASAQESYLSIPAVIEAALRSKAQAIHPGYGFLSENAAFARAVREAGLVFIGPNEQAIQAMGDKGRARERMIAAGVPVVPGYQGPTDDESLKAAAVEIGFPLLVKAAAGGGGKGMRVAWAESELLDAFGAARREALHSFNDDRLILERYIPHARHIEFQILADQFGHTVHLFERECSIQRRHQKIIEETPSVLVDAEMRRQMGQAAVKAAEAVNYTNAGTIEFIVDPNTHDFYFLEMNTRLQVEHPITELVTGLDLVKWQIRIAAGEELTLRQEDLSQRGHAIECRLYAEDPANSFMPASGPLLLYREPQGPGVRIDSGYSGGDEVTVHYDPLVAKLITWGEDRPTAIRKMAAALRETVLLGLTHNGSFLQDVLDDSDFRSGDIYTTWVEDHFKNWQPPNCVLPPEVLIAAALTFSQANQQVTEEQSGKDYFAMRKDPFNPWEANTGFRIAK